MATALLDHTDVVTGAFAQFRPTQFIRSTRPNATSTDAHQSPRACLPDSTVNIDVMAQPRPSSSQNQDRMPSVAPSMNQAFDMNHNPTSSPAGPSTLEMMELTATNALIEGVLGPNKDGRVRNPVPSKLKGKTDNKNGNFGVMHMGMSPGKKNEGQGKDAAAERDAAARRTSENTASRAKAAQSEKYIPPKKRGLEAALDGPSTSRGSPFSRDDHKQRGRPLAPDETKVEQARLLTLLRSINPVTVVDQICKAVAYFGGIPGAPPPEDGIFPESANTRETGALFIGWLAEIFPDVAQARSPELPRDTGPGAIKKKTKQVKGKNTADADPDQEPPNSRNGYGYGPAVSAPAWGLPPSLGLVNTPQMTPIPLPESRIPFSADQSKQVGQQSPETPAKPQLEDTTDGNTSTSKRRRGRPKGSTNKNKGRGESGQGSENTNAQNDGQVTGHQASESPHLKPAPIRPPVAEMIAPTTAAAAAAAPPSFTPIANNQPPAPKPVQALSYSEQAWPNNFPQAQASTSTLIQQVDDLSPEERAVIEAFKTHNPEPASVIPSPVPIPKSAPEGGQKRKRAPPKPKPVPAPISTYEANASKITPQGMGQFTNVPAVKASTAPMGTEAQWPAPEKVTPVPPPAKRPRQRKPKAASTVEPPSRTQTASVASSGATPILPPSTIPDSQATASQQSIPPSRPPAEGLEAHYERFANFQPQQNNIQPQQNGRNTPTAPQQQPRQQQKPASVPPAQASPQIQQHQQQSHQMLSQKSQQSNQQNLQQSVQQHVQQGVQQQNVQQNLPQSLHQGAQQGLQQGMQQTVQPQVQQSIQQNVQQSVPREESKMTTQATSRPSSTAYYNQRNQTSTNYNQHQYPSHQSTQLYGTHQASPQMSNNSYRSSSSHTLAQASPQFSQAENTYRTASPHALAQPSPSFSQTDNTFRNSTTQNVTQPTPSYSQAENPYRTPSTHTMTQPSSSYTTSRSHTQNQPSHQNHYSSFPDSYIDLPTLDSLGHAGSTSNQSVGLGAGSYGQSMGVGLGNSSRSSASSNSLYGSSSGLNSAFDTGTNDLLIRGVSRTSSHGQSTYGTSASGMGNAFDSTPSESEMRERLLRGLRR